MRWAAPLCLLAGAAAAEPSAVTYLLGGAVSGPYRLSVDLDAREAAEGRSAARGDGAGATAASLPTTTRRALPAAEVAAIRVLVATMLAQGTERRGCAPSADAVVAFIVTDGAAPRRFIASAPCMTPAATALFRAMSCAARPDGAHCAPARQ